MRTLKEIDEGIAKEAREAIDLLLKGNEIVILPEEDALWLQQETRFGEKYRQMYAILQVLENYLTFGSADGRPERLLLREQMKNMLDNL